MGAEWFEEGASGKTMKSAFKAAHERALWEYGHRGYTGSLAEKPGFVDMTKDFPKYSTIEEMEEILGKIASFPNIEDYNTVSKYDYKNKKIIKRAMTEEEKTLVKIAEAANDKWGPAVGIKIGDGEYVFFGWASS